MDAQSSPTGDLNDLERQLSEWQPSTVGLDVDRVVFAAGRASVRPGWGRIGWPVVSGCLALLTAVLSIGLVQERAACLELTALLNRPADAPRPSDPQNPTTAPSTEPLAVDSYLAARRALSDNPDGWLVVMKADPLERPSPTRPIWKAGSRVDVLEP